MNEHLPTVNKTFKRKKHRITPWITYGILKSINTRNKLFKKYINLKNPINKGCMCTKQEE